ncbi:MAG: hypothetical protein M1838_005914 [Thelocarpon superellum]|nr:MAG: hypothetical protein M1838_005914 [Thelocarpon superellum]
MSIQQAKVKSASSGDTLVLASVNNPAQERQLSLAFVTAPRLRKEGDEPYAFESRDHLRQLVVGKVVRFQVLYKISLPNGKPIELGRVLLPATGQSLPELAVAEGWLKLRDNAGRNGDTEEASALLEKLRLAEAKAKEEGKGVWAANLVGIETGQDLLDPKKFLDEWKGKPINAVVEKVLSGDRVIVRLLLSPRQHQQTLLLLAGIRAPQTKRTNASDGKEQPGQAGAEKSQQFVEERILQRNVQVTLVGLSTHGQLIGTVRHPNGSIAEFLLQAGLAWCNDFHTTLLGNEMLPLRQAEEAAKQKKLELFKDHVTSRGKAASDADAVVARVQSADTIYLRNKSGGERRVNLSSVRQPKPSDPKQSPFVQEAKDFLRKKLIGKSVRVSINGKRPAQDGFDEREMATVTHNDKNVALLLVEHGWVSVIRHRRDDDDRSPIYDELLLAEQEAQKEQKGMWAAKPPAVKTYADVSESVQKAKIQLSVLQRQKRVPAVVDFVKSGSRFTLLIPKEGAKLTFLLSGIRAPKSSRGPTDVAEPFGQEAHDFAVKRCLQRDVEVDVENIDKFGGFIGTLYINRESFARLLVEEGLASVHVYSAEQSGNARELLAAEQKAKEARKHLWHDWDPSKDVPEAEGDPTPANGTNGEAAAPARKKDYRDVVVSHIDETCRLKLQQVGTGSAALTEMMNAFKTFHVSKDNDKPLPGPPKAGDMVAARFSADGEWYRGKIRHNDREKKEAEILYVDYGNSEKRPWSALRPLSQPQFSTQTLKAQAVDAVLSFLHFPTQMDYLADAVHFVGQTTADKQLVANVDNTAPDGLLHVTLFDPKVSGSLQESVNADIVGEGLAMVPRKLKAWERSATDVLKALTAKEEVAKKERKGMWEYGDLTED